MKTRGRGRELLKRHYNNDEVPIFLKFLCPYLINAQNIEVLTIERKHSWRKCVKDNCCFMWVWCMLLSQKFKITMLPTQSSATSPVSSFQKRIWPANTDRYSLHNPGWDSGGTSHCDTELKGCLLKQGGHADYVDCVPGLFSLAGSFGVVLLYSGTKGEWFLEDWRPKTMQNKYHFLLLCHQHHFKLCDPHFHR